MLKKARFALAVLGLFVGYTVLQAMDSRTSFEDRAKSNGPTETVSSSTPEKPEQIDMKKLSEAFGNFIGKNLQSPGLSFDLDSMIKGIREGAAGRPSPLSEKEYEQMMTAVQERAFKEMSSTNLKNAGDFMEKNRKVEGVVEIVPEKLQYQVLKQGSGKPVDSHSSPKIHYTGKYQDGTVFGTSEEAGGPITIPLDQTIPGFSKGLVGMKEGEKRRLFVHPDLGYGTTGQLPPNELLIFDIEVIEANDESKRKVGVGGDDQAYHQDPEDDDLFLDEDEDDRETFAHDASSSLEMKK